MCVYFYKRGSQSNILGPKQSFLSLLVIEFFLPFFSSWKKDPMASSYRNNTSTKSNNKRKRTIKIKKAEQSNKPRDSFSKRKLGLFNKVTELSILCNAKTALIITSPNEKLYVYGYPNPNTVIKHFLDKENLVIDAEKRKQDEGIVETLRLQHEVIEERLKEESDYLEGVKETNKSSSCFSCWWGHSIDDMALESLEEFKTALVKLKLNLDASLEGKKIHITTQS